MTNENTITEAYEYATSNDGTVFSPYQPFVPGQTFFLDNYVKFRLTLYGNFEQGDYLFRGFSGIIHDPYIRSGGFGVSPFGRYPFGDGGICEPEREIGGQLTFSGDLSITIDKSFTGLITMSGTLSSLVMGGS